MLSLQCLLSPARPPLTSVRDLKCVADWLLFPTARCDHVLLHYANYGYQARGIPVALLKSAQETRARIPRALGNDFSRTICVRSAVAQRLLVAAASGEDRTTNDLAFVLLHRQQ